MGIGQISKRLQADGHSVEYRYDTEEQLIAVINQRGETYQLVRDALGRIVEEVDYWGQSRRYTYDAAGRLTATVDPLGQRIAFTTDKLGRITRKTLPGCTPSWTAGTGTLCLRRAGPDCRAAQSGAYSEAPV